MLAGEPSGDRHGAQVVRAILRRWPDAELVGLGGEAMEAEGVRLIASVEDLAVMGFAEVVPRLRFFRRLERRVAGMLLREPPDIVLPIGFPGLNLRIARRASQLAVPVVYYIGPQVWAWRPSRAKRLSRDAESIALILPFEAAHYPNRPDGRGARIEFVGHPLLEDDSRPDSAGLAAQLGIAPGTAVLALLPGSRHQELRRHAALFRESAHELQSRIPGLVVVVSRVASISASAYEGLPFPHADDTASLMALATAGLVKSGTCTLEAALAGMPFAVAYVAHPATFALARRLVRVPHLALANLVAGRRVVPEFLQREATPEAVADALEPLLDPSSAVRGQMVADLATIRAELGPPGAAARVAELVGKALAGGSATARSP